MTALFKIRRSMDLLRELVITLLEMYIIYLIVM